MAVTPRKIVVQAIVDLLDNTNSRKTAAQKIAAYLISEHRTGEINSILRDVMQLRFERTGVMEANVTSAFPLQQDVKTAITRLLPAKKVRLTETIDRSVIGGARVEANGIYIDATIRRQLDNIKQGVN